MQGILYSCIYLVLGAAMLLVIEWIDLDSFQLLVRLVLKVLIGGGIYIVGCLLAWRIWPNLMPDMIKETFVSVKRKITSH